MRRQYFLAALTLSASGCSTVLNLAFHNDTARDVEVCNLHRAANACVTVGTHSVVRMPLVADHAAESWAFRVSAGDVSRSYDFGHIDLWRLRSGSCRTPWSRGCEVDVRLDANGLIYWVAASENAAAGAQPDGFPIAPGA